MKCPAGHETTATDYCDTCGIAMDAAPPAGHDRAGSSGCDSSQRDRDTDKAEPGALHSKPEAGRRVISELQGRQRARKEQGGWNQDAECNCDRRNLVPQAAVEAAGQPDKNLLHFAER